AGVGGGDEEDRDEDDRKHREYAAQWQMVQGVEDRALHNQRAVFTQVLRDDVVAAEELFVQAGPAQDGEPYEADDRGHEQHASDELADGPPPGDPGNEHANERRPGDPPAPVEDGPAGEPAGGALAALVGADVEGHLHDVAQVDAQRLDQVLEQEDGRAEQQHTD